MGYYEDLFGAVCYSVRHARAAACTTPLAARTHGSAKCVLQYHRAARGDITFTLRHTFSPSLPNTTYSAIRNAYSTSAILVLLLCEYIQAKRVKCEVNHIILGIYKELDENNFIRLEKLQQQKNT